MGLARGVVFWTPRQIMHATVYLDGDAQSPDREVNNVAADLQLTNDVNPACAQRPQRLPRVLLSCAHADLTTGNFCARRISQAPAAIIGSDSNMPMVTNPRSASGMWLSGSRTNSSASRNRP